MNLFSSPTTDALKQRATEAGHNYRLTLDHAEPMLAEARAAGDVAKQVELMGVDYSPSLWLSLHLQYSASAHAHRTRSLLSAPDGAKHAPRQQAVNEALDFFLDFMEEMPLEAISALTDHLTESLDDHDLSQIHEVEHQPLTVAA